MKHYWIVLFSSLMVGSLAGCSSADSTKPSGVNPGAPAPQDSGANGNAQKIKSRVPPRR